jgi:hypothetical protein
VTAAVPSRLDRLAAQIDPELRGAPGLSAFNRLIVGAILVLIVVGILETPRSRWSPGWARCWC